MWIALLGTLALADVVRPPPETCPPGAVGRTGHVGPYCAPAGCEGCAGECVPLGLCVVEKSGRAGRSPTVHTWQVATGACASQEDCGEGATCVTEPRCALAAPPAPPAPPAAPEPPPAPVVPAAPGDAARACGCATTQPPLVAFLGSLGLLALRRRRSA